MDSHRCQNANREALCPSESLLTLPLKRQENYENLNEISNSKAREALILRFRIFFFKCPLGAFEAERYLNSKE